MVYVPHIIKDQEQRLRAYLCFNTLSMEQITPASLYSFYVWTGSEARPENAPLEIPLHAGISGNGCCNCCFSNSRVTEESDRLYVFIVAQLFYERLNQCLPTEEMVERARNSGVNSGCPSIVMTGTLF